VLSRHAEPAARGLSRGDVVEIEVSDLLQNGQGVGRASGVVVFVWGPLPGERARVRVKDVKAKYVVAEVLELLTQSSDRAEPFCPVFGECGGCQVQHLAYAAQLEWKRSMVTNALTRIGGLSDSSVSPTIGMENPRSYRNKMALVVRHGGGGSRTEFGFYQARSHDVVPIHGCPIVEPTLDAVIERLWSAAAADETAGAFRDAEHVVARSGRASGNAAISITTRRASQPLRAAAPSLMGAIPQAAGIVNSFDVPSPNAILGSNYRTLAGSSEIEEEIGGLRFHASAGSFFQINSHMVECIFGYVAPRLRSGLRIVDLYCGAGTFSLFFASHGATVLGVEDNPHAVREARENAARNGLADVEFFEGRAERLMRSGPVSRWAREADVIFLDPPRKGSDDATLGAIAAAKPAQVWYLSCNPATLARDLAALTVAGYVLDAVQPFDMFPQTGHVETLALLRRPA
jgi:23S rRNA (uracil1939-C5)-methyltransferase